MDLFRTQRGTLKQAFAQVREVSVCVSLGGHPLVDLAEMHTRPRDIFLRQRPQHHPGSVTTTDRQDKAITGSDRLTSSSGDCHRCCPCDGIGIIKYLELHKAFSRWDESTTTLREDQSQPPMKIPSIRGCEGLRSL